MSELAGVGRPQCSWTHCENEQGIGTWTEINGETLPVCEEHWFGNLDRERRQLRDLLHRIAVARRGDSPDVDDRLEDLPTEIDGMWTQIREATDSNAHLDALESALGDLIDALHDELRNEVGYNNHVLAHVEKACGLLHAEYQSYRTDW